MTHSYNSNENTNQDNERLPMPPAYYESEPPYPVYRPQQTYRPGYYQPPARPVQNYYPLYAPVAPPQTYLVYHHLIAPAFVCPFCRTTYAPFMAQRISAGGWLAFWVLLVLFFPLCWIGLLMKENYYCCSYCRVKLS